MTEQEKMDSLSRMFSTLIRTPLSEVESVIRKGNIEQRPVAPVEELTDTYTKIAAENEPMTFVELEDKTDNIESQLEAQNTEKLSDMYETIMAGAGEFGTGEYKGPTKKQLGLTPKIIVDEEPQDFMVKEEAVTPDVLKQQVDLEQELEKLPQIKTEPVVTEQPQPEEDKEQPKAETTGTTYTSSSLYDSLKSKDEKIFNDAAKHLYNQGITRTEWGGKQPLFDFVEYYSGGNSSAFGPGQIVYSTAQKMLDKGFIKDKETKEFAKKMIAAQKIFKNMINNRNKYKEYRPEKAVNTPKAREEKWLETLGITEKEFLNYVKQGYFLPSNHSLSKQRRKNKLMTGIPLKILGDNYEKNYFNLYKVVLKEKLSRAESLDSLLKLYHGSKNDALNEAYSKKTKGFLKLMEE